MLLATGLLIEFGRFLQVLTWIMLPVLLLSVIVTTWHHYRRKKTKTEEAIDPVENWLELPADYVDQGGKKGAYLLFDHSGLIRQYQHKLSYNEARYAALKHDFEKLELKYNSATGLAATRFANENTSQMENATEQMQERMDNLTSEFNAEKMEFLARLDQLDQSYKNLQKENEGLLEQIGAQTISDEEKEIIVNQWKEENNVLKGQIVAHQNLKELIEEKRAQIDFLQAQAEQRIRNYHDAENQRAQIKIELDHSTKLYQQTLADLNLLKNEFNDQRKTAAGFGQLIDEKEKQLGSTADLLHRQNDQLLYKENILKEIRQQNEMLNAIVGDSQEKIEVLQGQVEFEQGRVKSLEQKLLANRQLLRRLYKEFSACLDEENKNSPVVSLRPSYANDTEWDETAVQ